MFKINSTLRNDLGTGTSRIRIPLNIPANAEYCYISISTASGNESQQIQKGIHLFNQLVSKIPATGAQAVSLLATLSERVVGVSTGSIIDLYVILDVNNTNLFLSGWDFRSIGDYTRNNYNGGVLTISCKGIAGRTIYLGLSNRSSMNSVWVNVETVAAVIKPEVPTETSIQAANYTNLGWKSYGNGNIEKCMEYSRIALTFDSSQVAAMLNLGLCYLIQKNEAEAITLYMNALAVLKQKEMAVRKHFVNEALRDIRHAKEKYPDMAVAEDIVELFKMEQNN